MISPLPPPLQIPPIHPGLTRSEYLTIAAWHEGLATRAEPRDRERHLAIAAKLHSMARRALA